MTATHYGFATPLPFNKLDKGMLVLATPSTGQKYFGVVTKINHDFVLIVLSASDGDIHEAIDLGYAVDNLWQINGSLELEPQGKPFIGNVRRTEKPGYVINSDGVIACQFVHRNGVGRHQLFAVDLNTGEHVERADKVAGIDGAKLFIRQDGRKDRFEWPALTPDH